MNDTNTVSPEGQCPWCGPVWHSGMCPRVEAIEYHQNGTIKRVEFREAGMAERLPRIAEWEWNPTFTGDESD